MGGFQNLPMLNIYRAGLLPSAQMPRLRRLLQETAMAASQLPLPTLSSLARDLAAGTTTSRKLVEDCLARIHAPEGEGARAFVSVAAEQALQAADAMDLLRQAGAAPSPFAGIPLAIKDLFDIRGEVTTAGSKVLANQPPAQDDAVAVARLRAAGFIFIGRANMTEFAYSGLGMNPHYGTPRSPYERMPGEPEQGRVSGGSTSGGAVAVADGMAHGALGTDTGGSCRIPAAFCGIVGFKPTARRVPAQGALPLSTSLDSIGPLARSVQCCATLDAILADETPVDVKPLAVAGLRLGILSTIALDDLDPQVARQFEATVEALEDAGAIVSRIEIPALLDIATMNAKGGYTAAESYAWHRTWIETQAQAYDPRVLVRMSRGQEQSAADYINLHPQRSAIIAGFEAAVTGLDAVIFPTTAIVPPRIADLGTEMLPDGDAAYTAANLLALRNATLINTVDGCAVSLPIGPTGGPPVGLTIAGPAGSDHHIMAVAAGIEARLA